MNYKKSQLEGFEYVRILTEREINTTLSIIVNPYKTHKLLFRACNKFWREKMAILTYKNIT